MYNMHTKHLWDLMEKNIFQTFWTTGFIFLEWNLFHLEHFFTRTEQHQTAFLRNTNKN